MGGPNCCGALRAMEHLGEVALGLGDVRLRFREQLLLDPSEPVGGDCRLGVVCGDEREDAGEATRVVDVGHERAVCFGNLLRIDESSVERLDLFAAVREASFVYVFFTISTYLVEQDH